jgi:hypothetical protein
MSLLIIDEVMTANSKAGNGLQPLPLSESTNIRDRLAFLYGSGEVGRRFSYQTLRNAEGFRSSDGWRLVPDFIGKGELFFFLNPDESLTVWRCVSAEWLVELLADCFGFPFYATSTDLSSLFCFDDHDCVLISGNAVRNVERRGQKDRAELIEKQNQQNQSTKPESIKPTSSSKTETDKTP